MSPKKQKGEPKKESKEDYSFTKILDEIDMYMCARVSEPIMKNSEYEEAIKELEEATSENIDEVTLRILNNIEVKNKKKLKDAEIKVNNYYQI